MSCTESEVDHPTARRHRFNDNVVVFTIPVNYDPEWGYCSGLHDSVGVTRNVPLLAPDLLTSLCGGPNGPDLLEKVTSCMSILIVISD